MLYIIVPVHNRAAVTARFAADLARQTCTDYRLVLVDDGCTDDTVERVRGALPPERLIVLQGDGQLWWAGALQRAYEHLRSLVMAPTDAVLIINDDVGLEPDFLARGLDALAQRRNACIQAVGVDERTGEVDRGAVADLVRLRFRAAGPGERPNCLSTRGLIMSADTFVGSGGFRPGHLPHYLSDYEFTLRLRRRGAELWCDERFTARVRLELTGLERYPTDNPRRLWSSAFSNRAKFNPRHWTAFVLMACPAWVAPLHVARIWLGFCKAMLRASLASVSFHQ